MVDRNIGQDDAEKKKMLRNSFFSLYYSINALDFQSRSGNNTPLSYRDIMYLNIIMFTEDCTVTKLVDVLNITKPAVTVKVNNLEERGLITRKKDPNDSRANILIPTPAAYAIYGNEDRRINRAFESMIDDYTPEELEKFSEMVKILASELTNDSLDKRK